MIISDLDHLEFASEKTNLIGGDAVVAIHVEGEAYGQFTSTTAVTYAYSNRYTAVGVGVVVGVAVSPYSQDDGKSYGDWRN